MELGSKNIALPLNLHMPSEICLLQCISGTDLPLLEVDESFLQILISSENGFVRDNALTWAQGRRRSALILCFSVLIISVIPVFCMVNITIFRLFRFPFKTSITRKKPFFRNKTHS